jgi:hypothetical protein
MYGVGPIIWEFSYFGILGPLAKTNYNTLEFSKYEGLLTFALSKKCFKLNSESHNYGITLSAEQCLSFEMCLVK